jgi:hypothetical protein
MDHGVGHGELLVLLDSAGRHELEAQLGGVPKSWGNTPGCLDIVAENSASLAEIDC